MRFEISITLFLTYLAFMHAESTSETQKEETGARLFLSTFTVILSTVTSTSTIGTTTTCTTSSSAMNACSAIGRRRRGILYDENERLGRVRRGLFYDDDEVEDKDGSISSPTNHSKRSTEEMKETDSSLTIDKANLIPLTIQSGFSVPEGFFQGTPRFKLAYGTSTVITTFTSTATRSLIIFCSSITDFQVCSGSG